jgi:molecular chaperone HscA
MAAGAARIRITYQVDADGLLSVSARELRSGVEASITVKPSYGLGDDDVARMLQDSFSSADTDMQLRALREEQVEAERILLATQSALDGCCLAVGRRTRRQSTRLIKRRDVRAIAQGSDHQASRSRGGGAGPRHRRIRVAAHGPQRAQRAGRARR